MSTKRTSIDLTKSPVWRMLTGWSMIGDRFYGNPSAYVGSVKNTLSKLRNIPLSRQDTLDTIVLLERTALELRELIGEEGEGKR